MFMYLSEVYYQWLHEVQVQVVLWHLLMTFTLSNVTNSAIDQKASHLLSELPHKSVLCLF